jgi:hypothetical protein
MRRLFYIGRLPMCLLYDYKIKMQKTFKKKNNIIREHFKAATQGIFLLRRAATNERLNGWMNDTR